MSSTGALGAPAEEPQQVDGRLVGPVNVLDHHHVQRAWLADLAQQRPEQLVPGRAGRQSSASSPPSWPARSNSGPSGRG